MASLAISRPGSGLSAYVDGHGDIQIELGSRQASRADDVAEAKEKAHSASSKH